MEEKTPVIGSTKIVKRTIATTVVIEKINNMIKTLIILVIHLKLMLIIHIVMADNILNIHLVTAQTLSKVQMMNTLKNDWQSRIVWPLLELSKSCRFLNPVWNGQKVII